MVVGQPVMTNSDPPWDKPGKEKAATAIEQAVVIAAYATAKVMVQEKEP